MTTNSDLPSDSAEPDFLLKLILIGDSGVGKTNFLGQFVRNKFHPESKTTIGVEFALKTLRVKDKLVRAQIWDTAGQERYRAITTSYYRGVVGAMILYDITSSRSFNSVQRWLDELRVNSEPGVVVMLIGNKTDNEGGRSVTATEGKNFAQKEGMMFMETSAKEGFNVSEAFSQLVDHLLEVHEKVGFANIKNPKEDEKVKTLKKGTNVGSQGSCC
jgi:small GTP-binding protein